MDEQQDKETAVKEEKRERQCLIVVGEPVRAGIVDAYRRCVLETRPDVPPLYVLGDRTVYEFTGAYPLQPYDRRESLIKQVSPKALILPCMLRTLHDFLLQGGTAFCIYGGENPKMREALAGALRKEFPDTTIRFTKNI